MVDGNGSKYLPKFDEISQYQQTNAFTVHAGTDILPYVHA